MRNAVAYILPEFFWGLAWALTIEGPMAATFADGFGGSEAFVGLSWLVGGVALAVPMLLCAVWVEPLRTKRGLVFWGHLAGSALLGLVALLLILVAPSGAAASRGAYLAGTGLFFLSVGFLIPGWMALLGELFPAASRPRILATAFVANRVGALLGGAITHAVLAPGADPTRAWALLFGLAAVVSAVGSLPFLWIRESPRPRPPASNISAHLKGLGRILREAPTLGRFMLADALGIASVVLVAFYADAALRADGLPRDSAGTWVAVGALGHLVSSVLVLGSGARVTPRLWLAAGMLAAAGAAAWVAMAPGPTAYLAAAFAGGLYLGSRTACHAPQVMLLVPGRDATAPIGLVGALAMALQGVLPWLTGLLLPGTGYAAVFWGVALCAGLGGALLLLWVREAPGGEVG